MKSKNSNNFSGLFLPTSFRRNYPGGLLIPDYLPNEKQKVVPPFMGVSLGYTDLFNKESTWKDITDRLQQYSLSQVMDVIGRISTVLNHFPHDRQNDAQFEVCRIIFGVKFEEFCGVIRQWVNSRANEKSPAFYSLFYELQLVNFAKIALLTLPEDEKPHNDSMVSLGEALLMITDIINKETGAELKSKDINSPDGFKSWHQFLLTNALFHASDNLAHALPRTYDIYLTDKPHLKNSDVYIDLPKMLEEITGITPEMLWTIIFSLAGHWSGLKDDDAATAPGPINFDTYFTKTCNFSAKESDVFFSFLSNDAQTHRDEIRKQGYGPQAILPYNTLSFEDKPLVVIGGNVYCISESFLLRKMTRGLHYLFLNRISSRKIRDRYLTYMGHVFSDYIHRLWTRTFPPESCRYISGEELESYAADAIEVPEFK